MSEQKAPSIEEVLQNARSVFSKGVVIKSPEVVIPEEVQTENEPSNEPKTEAVQTEVVKAETQPKTEKPVNAPKSIIETPLFKFDSSAKKSGEENPIDLFNKKTGLNIEKPEDIFEKADMIADAIKANDGISAEVRAALDYQSFFEKQLPADLKASVVAFAEGKDYKRIMQEYSNPDVDFTKRFNQYADVFPVILRYNPELTRDEFEEMDESARKVVTSSAKRAYDIEFESVVAKNNEFQDAHGKKVSNMYKSIDETMQNVRREFPDLSDKNMKEIRSRLELTSFAGDFMNSDGTYKPDAGVRLGLALFGKETIDTMMQSVSAKMQQESQAEIQKRVSEEIELISRSRNDTPPAPPVVNDKSNNPVETVLKNNEGIFGKKSGFNFTNRQERP